jgi:hypothetical protein
MMTTAGSTQNHPNHPDRLTPLFVGVSVISRFWFVLRRAHIWMEMSSQGGHDPGEVEEVRRLFCEIHQISISKGKLSFKDYHKLSSLRSVRLGNFVLPHEYASTTTGAVGSKSYAEESTDGLFYKAPDEGHFSDDVSESMNL